MGSGFSGQCQEFSPASALLKLIIAGDFTGEHLINFAGAGDIEQDGPLSAGQTCA
jgi:hypothetical protein